MAPVRQAWNDILASVDSKGLVEATDRSMSAAYKRLVAKAKDEKKAMAEVCGTNVAGSLKCCFRNEARLLLNGIIHCRCLLQEGQHFAVYLFVHTKHSQKASPFSVARLKMYLPFHNRLACNRVHGRSASPLPPAPCCSARCAALCLLPSFLLSRCSLCLLAVCLPAPGPLKVWKGKMPRPVKPPEPGWREKTNSFMDDHWMEVCARCCQLALSASRAAAPYRSGSLRTRSACVLAPLASLPFLCCSVSRRSLVADALPRSGRRRQVLGIPILAGALIYAMTNDYLYNPEL